MCRSGPPARTRLFARFTSRRVECVTNQGCHVVAPQRSTAWASGSKPDARCRRNCRPRLMRMKEGPEGLIRAPDGTIIGFHQVGEEEMATATETTKTTEEKPGGSCGGSSEACTASDIRSKRSPGRSRSQHIWLHARTSRAARVRHRLARRHAGSAQRSTSVGIRPMPTVKSSDPEDGTVSCSGQLFSRVHRDVEEGRPPFPERHRSGPWRQANPDRITTESRRAVRACPIG